MSITVNELLELGFYLFIVLGLVLGGGIIGYSKGLFERIKDYDKLLDEQRNFYEKEIDKLREDGEEWKR